MLFANQLRDIFASGSVFHRDSNMQFDLTIDGVTLVNVGGILKVGTIGSTNIGPNSITASMIDFDSYDVDHSSANIAATDVGNALEEVANGYLSRLELSGGTMTGSIDMSGNQITNLADPSAPGDAVNVNYLSLAMQKGYYYGTPTGFADPMGANGTLQATWVRAYGSIYYTGNPSSGDTLTLHGVTLTFHTIPGPNRILIGPSADITAFNTAAEINVNLTPTIDGIPCNVQFFAIQDSGAGTCVRIVCKNEDPPNTPEDGNSKQLSVVSLVLTVVPFRGAYNSVHDGMMIVDMFSDSGYLYDSMTPAAPWVPITASPGSITADMVLYDGPPLPFILPTPASVEALFVAVNGIIGSGVIPLAHHLTHELGGGDDVNVAGLSGKLADLQDAGWLTGRTVANIVPADTEVLTWVAAASRWEPKAGGGGGGVDYVTLTGLTVVSGANFDMVYVSGPNQITQAKADADLTMPARAMITDAITGRARMCGYVSGLAGLTSGATYYLSPTVAGAITTTIPSTVGHWIQEVGYALNATTFVISIKPAIKITV